MNITQISGTQLETLFEELTASGFIAVFNDEAESVLADPEAHINIHLHLEGNFIKKIACNSKLIKNYIPLTWQALHEFITIQRELATKNFKLN